MFNCDHCETVCSHIGAAFSLILEDKYALGLSEIPKPDLPLELLSEEELELRALAEREKRSRDESFRLTSTDPKRLWPIICSRVCDRARRTDWRYAVSSGAHRIAPALTFARIASGPAST